MFKIINRLRNIATLGGTSDDNEMKAKLYEKCGDLLADSDVKAYRLALYFYSKMNKYDFCSELF